MAGQLNILQTSSGTTRRARGYGPQSAEVGLIHEANHLSADRDLAGQADCPGGQAMCEFVGQCQRGAENRDQQGARQGTRPTIASE